jgi:putative nucleotidyltransferase with HDIG domain
MLHDALRGERSTIAQRTEEAIAYALEDPRDHVLLQRMADHDQGTFLHLFAVARLASKMACLMGARTDELNDIVKGALFHDLGKLHVEGSLLRAPRKLSAQEWVDMRKHTLAGEVLLREHGSVAASRIAVSHHERLDGTGYPYGLRGGAISLHVQLIAVADIYDTLTGGRPYAASMSRQTSVIEIDRFGGRHYARELVDALRGALELDNSPASL